MIAKGTTHNNGAKLASYLVTSKDGERAELHELRGFAEADIVDAFRSTHVIAAATQCEKPFYHLQVRTPDGEELTKEQWLEVADRFEAKLGLTDQPRAIAFHDKHEHVHMHIAWSRIDEETMTAKELKFDHLRLKETCRELEVEMGLTLVRNDRAPDEPPAPGRGEFEEARRLGIDVQKVREAIRESWHSADNGQAFAAALAEHDLALAQGDRRDYVVVDPEGGLHALGKRLLGCSMSETRERLSDLDRESLPTIEQARDNLDDQLFHRYGVGAPDEPEPAAPELGSHPEAERAAPFEKDALEVGKPPAGPVIGAAVFGLASAAADTAATVAEQSISFIGDMFGGGSSPPPRAPGRGQAATLEPATPPAQSPPMKPADEPREIDAQRLRTASRDTAADDPATRASFANNPAAATPDVAQQILNRWRQQREKDRDIER